jgi:hypothetical protein
MNPLARVFDTSHYADTVGRKFQRAFELGPKYYFRDLPRYFVHRRRLRLPFWDWAALFNPLREFRQSCQVAGELPPGYEDGLRALNTVGIQLTIPRGRLEALLRIWWRTRLVDGDTIECGSFRGATALLLAWLERKNNLGRRVHMLDTFSGMPLPTQFDSSRKSGEFQPPPDQVELIRRQAEALGVRDLITIYAGLFCDSFAQPELRKLRFAFGHIDANIYAGTLDASQFVLSRLEPGGAIVFDDYNGVCDLGARLAIDRALAGTGRRPRPLTASSAWVQHPRGTRNGGVRCQTDQ